MESDLEAMNSSAAAAASSTASDLATPAAGDGVGPAGLKNQPSGSRKIIFSMGDEYVAEYVDKKALVERLSKAMGGAKMVEIEWGNHSLSNKAEEAVQAIIDFVRREGLKGWDDPWN